MKMTKTVVTARNIITDEQIYITCSDFKDAFNTAGKLHNITLKENTYVQIRLRGSIPDINKGYRWVSLCKWIGA